VTQLQQWMMMTKMLVSPHATPPDTGLKLGPVLKWKLFGKIFSKVQATFCSSKHTSIRTGPLGTSLKFQHHDTSHLLIHLLPSVPLLRILNTHAHVAWGSCKAQWRKASKLSSTYTSVTLINVYLCGTLYHSPSWAAIKARLTKWLTARACKW